MPGPVAVMSFDHAQIEAVKELAPGLPRGIVAESKYTGMRNGRD